MSDYCVNRQWAVSLPSLALCLSACQANSDGGISPGRVCVAADGYASVVTVAAPATVRVGEWTSPHATRRSGPWALVSRTAAASGQRSFDACPAPIENEVSSNLTWTVEPPGFARFNLAAAGDDADSVRRVRFSAPGSYHLSGRSDYPTRSSSNVVLITVR